MKICSLASCSKGNCLYLETEDTRVLVDVGLSLRETLLRMETVGIDASGASNPVMAIFPTRNRSDCFTNLPIKGWRC